MLCLPVVNANRGVPKSQHREQGAGWGEQATMDKLEKMTPTSHHLGREEATAQGKCPLATTGVFSSSSPSLNKQNPVNGTSATNNPIEFLQPQEPSTSSSVRLVFLPELWAMQPLVGRCLYRAVSNDPHRQTWQIPGSSVYRARGKGDALL